MTSNETTDAWAAFKESMKEMAEGRENRLQGWLPKIEAYCSEKHINVRVGKVEGGYFQFFFLAPLYKPCVVNWWVRRNTVLIQNPDASQKRYYGPKVRSSDPKILACLKELAGRRA